MCVYAVYVNGDEYWSMVVEKAPTAQKIFRRYCEELRLTCSEGRI
jgi:hypothetical protein